MKANEAPEKLYLHLTTGSHILNGKYCEYKPAKIRFDDKIIEYTRTDAFVEKAAEYLMDYEFNDSPTIADRRKRVEDFKNYMKGE